MTKTITTAILSLLFPGLQAQSFVPADDPSFIKQTNALLIQTHPHQFEEINVDTVLRLGEKRYTIVYGMGTKMRNEVLVKKEGKGLLKIAEFKEILKKELPTIIKASHKKQQNTLGDFTAFAVTVPSTSIFYCIKSTSGERYYYDRLGHNINPKFK